MDAKVLDILENCFEWNRDRKLIRKIRKEVEDFERWTEMKAAEMLRAVGLKDRMDHRPAELSGGMRKRAALARALALDPQVLFFDEPSAGLDPLSSQALDELILQLRDSLGSSIVLVTHELPSIYRVADTCLFLDNQTRTQIALGPLQQLLDEGPEVVQRFLRRGDTAHGMERR